MAADVVLPVSNRTSTQCVCMNAFMEEKRGRERSCKLKLESALEHLSRVCMCMYANRIENEKRCRDS